MIHINQLSFRYKASENIVLDDLTLHIKPHRITILLGNNGSGKTTLLNCIDGMYELPSGTITKTEDTILISDHPILYEYLTGREYLDVIVSLKEDRDNQALPQQLIQDLNLAKDLDKLIINYSLGMKHKLSLITALILGYQVYLIDEPLTALDPDSQDFMINYFKRLREKGYTFLISTHMMYVAYELADDILILNQGKITAIENRFESYAEFEDYVLNSLRIQVTSERA